MVRRSKERQWKVKRPAFELAAAEVLSSAGHPMTLRELTQGILDRKLVKPKGKTPERSLYSVIFRANQRAKERGHPLPFVCKKDRGGRVVYSPGINRQRQRSS